jgi:hypothetical protein
MCLSTTSDLRRDLPMSKVFLQISFAPGSAYFALGGVFFVGIPAPKRRDFKVILSFHMSC